MASLLHALADYRLHCCRAFSITHAFFNRHGGVSPAPWDSLNVSHGVGDSEDNVFRNRSAIKDKLGFKRLVSAQQVHGPDLLHIQTMPESDIEIAGYDAIITDIADIGLMVQQADCQAVLFADPQKHAVGIAHSGWRGSVWNIIGKTVLAMRDAFHTDPADLLAAISPSLGPCCAEFINYAAELPETFHTFKNDTHHFNFWEISRSQLATAGLKKENISVAAICTCCNEDYFSYRREGTTGRCASIIGITDTCTTGNNQA